MSRRRSSATPSITSGNESRPRPDGALGTAPKRRVNRGLTCANCRARKTRCDGGQPGCKTCEVYQSECRYDQPPPLSQIRALTQRLQDAEATIRELQAERRAEPISPSPMLHNSDAAILPEEVPVVEHLPSNVETMPAFPQVYQSLPTDALLQPLVAPQPVSPSSTGPDRTLDLSVDADGQLCYYGPTSNVYEPLHSPEAIQPRQPSRENIRTTLTQGATQFRSWEAFAIDSAADRSDIPRHTARKLLETHWTWIAPTFMWVYRPAFVRDMATGGPYFSPFLLTVLCAHSARFSEERVVGEMLISRARIMLGNEIDKSISIPTVQGLLQLSARDLAYGRTSQAWLYSGMAFRMVNDLGLHHSSGKNLGLGQLNAEDLEIRRRLFWSCYFWDKAISLYLGRMPMLVDLSLGSAPDLLDDTMEHEPWSPNAALPSLASSFDYPPVKAHTITCFINSCKLSVIINNIIQQLYSRRNSPDLEISIPAIRDTLDNWRRDTPSHLVLDPNNLPQRSPPPNILTQNLLYFTTVILLHRPFLSVASHKNTCRLAADHSEKLLLLLERTFGFNRVTYLQAYCIYTSASVMLIDVKAGDQGAYQKIQTLLRALQGGIATCPILQRSLDIITNSLRQVAQPVPQLSDPITQLATLATEPLPHGYAQVGLNIGSEGNASSTLLPAFLFSDAHHDAGFDFVNNPTSDLSSLLDCFPENRIDGFQGDWFLS